MKRNTKKEICRRLSRILRKFYLKFMVKKLQTVAVIQKDRFEVESVAGNTTISIFLEIIAPQLCSNDEPLDVYNSEYILKIILLSTGRIVTSRVITWDYLTSRFYIDGDVYTNIETKNFILDFFRSIDLREMDKGYIIAVDLVNSAKLQDVLRKVLLNC